MELYNLEPKWHWKWLTTGVVFCGVIGIFSVNWAMLFLVLGVMVCVMHGNLMYRFKRNKKIRPMLLNIFNMFFSNLFLTIMIHVILLNWLVHYDWAKPAIAYFYALNQLLFDYVFTFLYQGPNEVRQLSQLLPTEAAELQLNFTKANMSIMTVLMFMQLRHFYFHAWGMKNLIREQLDLEYYGYERFECRKYGPVIFWFGFSFILLWIIFTARIGGECAYTRPSISCFNRISSPISLSIFYLFWWTALALFFNYAVTSVVRNERLNRLIRLGIRKSGTLVIPVKKNTSTHKTP